MTRTVHIPDSLTEDDLWLIEQVVAKLAAIRAKIAELKLREGKKTDQGTEMIVSQP